MITYIIVKKDCEIKFLPTHLGGGFRKSGSSITLYKEHEARAMTASYKNRSAYNAAVAGGYIIALVYENAQHLDAQGLKDYKQVMGLNWDDHVSSESSVEMELGEEDPIVIDDPSSSSSADDIVKQTKPEEIFGKIDGQDEPIEAQVVNTAGAQPSEKDMVAETAVPAEKKRGRPGKKKE